MLLKSLKTFYNKVRRGSVGGGKEESNTRVLQAEKPRVDSMVIHDDVVIPAGGYKPAFMSEAYAPPSQVATFSNQCSIRRVLDIQ